MKTRNELDKNIEKLVNEGDFSTIIGFYQSNDYITEVRDRGNNILFITDDNYSIYINKTQNFELDPIGWIDFIKYNS
jgi:hypothetical protein